MRTVQILTLLFIAAFIVSCSGPPEERVLTSFVSALQAGDETAASQVSLVKFPGDVSTWEIVEVGPESSTPFQLPTLQQERVAMVKELDAMGKKNDLFIQDNEELYLEYKPLKDKDPETEFTGELQAFDEDFSARMDAQKALDAKIREAGEEKEIALPQVLAVDLGPVGGDVHPLVDLARTAEPAPKCRPDETQRARRFFARLHAHVIPTIAGLQSSDRASCRSALPTANRAGLDQAIAETLDAPPVHSEVGTSQA